MIYVGISFGSVVLKNVPIKECAFISACLSLSSTPLVMKFLQPKGKEKSDSPEIECGQYLMGMLVMQDVQLGKLNLIPKIIPKHIKKNKREENSSHSTFNYKRY